MSPDAAPTPAFDSARPRRARSSGEIPHFQREGTLFLAVTFLVGVAALNTGNNLLYLVLILLLSFFVCSGVLALSTLANLRILRRPPARAFAGVPALGEILVENRKRWLPSFALVISDLASGRRSPTAVHFVAKISARAEANGVVEYLFPRRGVERLHRLSVSTRFPFGFLERGRSFWWTEEVLVYPRVNPLGGEHLLSAIGVEGQASGMKGAGQDIYSIRPFVQGDPLKHMSWKQTAKRSQLMVKDFEAEDRRRVSLVLDLAPCLRGSDPAEGTAGEAGEAPGSRTPARRKRKRRDSLARPAGQADLARSWEARIEEAIGLAASFASYFVTRGFSVRFATHGTLVPFGSGPEQADRILSSLARLDPYGMAGLGPIPLWEGQEVGERTSAILVRAKGNGAGMAPSAGFDRVAEA